MCGYKMEMRCSPDASRRAAAASPTHSLAVPEHFLCIYSGPDTCVQVTDLLPGTAYEYRAAALNSHGAGPWSAVGVAATRPAAPLPPCAPTLVCASCSGLSVAWAEPYGQGSPVSGYTLAMARMGPANLAPSACSGVGGAAAAVSSCSSSSLTTSSRAPSASSSVCSTAQPNGSSSAAGYQDPHGALHHCQGQGPC